MSWIDVYPFLSDEMVDAYRKSIETEEEQVIADAFAVEKVFNLQSGDHLVVVTLSHHPFINDDPFRTTSDRPEPTSDGTWIGLFDYKRLLEGAATLKRLKPQIVLRVYLPSDLADLVTQLVQAGCEIFLMKKPSSLRHVKDIWKFLALEEKRWITFTEASFGWEMIHDVRRTEELMKTSLCCWRAPHLVGDRNQRLQARSYRPIDSTHFGVKGGWPAALLMQALIWHGNQGSIELSCVEQDGRRGYTIEGSKWPSSSFGEWYLLAAIFPRLAFSGILTFLIWQRKTVSYWYLLDIEYVTWANSASEVILSPSPEEGECEWSEIPESEGLVVRPGTRVIRRPRRRVYEGFLLPETEGEITRFEAFNGELIPLLDWAAENVSDQWWIDLSPLLTVGSTGAELFTDRRFEKADVVVCGYYFSKVTRHLAEWAHSRGLDCDTWREGAIRKLPKLEGPLTMWNTDFTRSFARALRTEGEAISPAILLDCWIQQKHAVVMTTTAKQMGWKVLP